MKQRRRQKYLTELSQGIIVQVPNDSCCKIQVRNGEKLADTPVGAGNTASSITSFDRNRLLGPNEDFGTLAERCGSTMSTTRKPSLLKMVDGLKLQTLVYSGRTHAI